MERSLLWQIWQRSKTNGSGVWEWRRAILRSVKNCFRVCITQTSTRYPKTIQVHILVNLDDNDGNKNILILTERLTESCFNIQNEYKVYLNSRCVLYSQSPSHESVAIVSYGKNMGWKLSNLFVPEISTKLDFGFYFHFLIWLFTSTYENQILPVKLDLLRRVDWKDLKCFDCFLSMGVNSSILPIMRFKSPKVNRWCNFQ